jgi:chemotaxis protein MotB
MKNSCIADNWDLSAKRATAIARELQLKYAVDPSRIIAGGRSEFYPKVPNTSVDNKAINRRTEIIIMPKLDEFFKLLEIPTEKK